MEPISNEIFVREIKILWQNSDVTHRKMLGSIIRDCFNIGDRAEKIINKMQEKI